MKGFFYDEKEIKKKEKKEVVYDCHACKLYKSCNSPKMPPTGLGRKNILVVAEAPGKREDRLGVQLVGESGQLLREVLKSNNYSLDKDFYKTNAIICRPPNNRKPTKKEIKCCNKNLMNFIREKKPDKIIALGGTAFEALTGETGIEKWVGRSIPDQKLGCWIYPNYHPAYLIRNKKDILLKNRFEEFLLNAVEDKTEFPIYETDNYVEIIDNVYAATIYLQGLNAFGTDIVVDVETTGKRPFVEGHEIVCMSIADSPTSVKVFPIFEDKEFLHELKKLLQNKNIGKIAHNLKFENNWFEYIFKCRVKNWQWDTMIAAHVLDNTRKITGLKDQTYINFGIKGYDDEVVSYLISKDKSTNSFNNIRECDLRKLMYYCALDSLFAYWLRQKQQEQMSGEDLKAYDLLHQGVLEFCKIENNGVCIDSKYYKKAISFLTKKMSEIENKIYSSKEVMKWDGEKAFKHTSNKDLPHLLFDILQIKSTAKTAKGNKSVAESALEKIDYPFVKNIVRWRKMKKIRDTYLQGYVREDVGGKMHPSFHLNTTVTYRPSVSAPNFANIPKHNEKAKKFTRTGIIPDPGNQLVEVDYSGIEVRISACYHQDPVMLNYIKDPTTDMHRDQGMELFIMKKEEMNKELRQLAKNNFVFPQFYGDWWKVCAENLWPKLDEQTKQHLKNKGINGLGKLIKKDDKIIGANGFYEHVKNVENKFWNERFVVYGQWKKRTWEKYQKTGVIKTLTNFNLRKKMSKNDALNYPIQGSAFHCLLLSMIYLNRYLRKNKMRTKIIGQIYDSIVFDMCPEEKESLKPVIRYVMTKKIKKKFDWIIVPLDIEMEVSEINGNWNKMQVEEI